MQAIFKVVKNPDLVLNDNDIKSRIIAAVNQYFALENWDFGDKFFFSEMANYVILHDNDLLHLLLFNQWS